MELQLTISELKELSSKKTLSELADKILNFNYNNSKKYYKERVSYEICRLTDLWREARKMDEDQCGTVEDFYQWITDTIDSYAVKTNVKYPIVLCSCGTLLWLSEAIIDVLSYVCTDYVKFFEKDISGKSVYQGTSILSANTEKKYKDLLDIILNNQDESHRISRSYASMWSILKDTGSYFTHRWPPASFPMEYRDWLCGDLEKLFRESIEEFENSSIENRINGDVLKQACTIFYEMTKNFSQTNTDLYDRLVKLIALYFATDTATRSCNEEAVSFLSTMIQTIVGNEENVVQECPYGGLNNIVSFEIYPPSANAAIAKLIEDVNQLKSIESVQAWMSKEAIDSAYNFGASQLKSNALNSQNFAVNKIDDKYKAKFSKLNNIWNEVTKVKPGKLRAKINSAYFKKWYGRIPSMYSRYGGEATITENKMKGDPTLILANSAPKYLQNLVTETNKMFQGLIDLSRRVASANEIQAKLNIVKGFCHNYKIEDPRDPKGVELSIKNEAMLRIARCIFQDNNVYGYSPEGIVENGKFPTANHIVTSLFIENSHEEPKEQSVNEIFTTPDSLTVFAHPQKIASFDELFKKCSNSITQNFNHKIVSEVHDSMELNFRNYSNSLKRKSDDIDGGDADEASLNKKIAKSIENGIVDGLDLAIEQKARCLQVCGAMYDMLGRVQRLAKLCVAALHNAEAEHADTRMNAGVNNKLRNATNTRLNQVNKSNNAGRYQENLFNYK